MLIPIVKYRNWFLQAGIYKSEYSDNVCIIKLFRGNLLFLNFVLFLVANPPERGQREQSGDRKNGDLSRK